VITYSGFQMSQGITHHWSGQKRSFLFENESYFAAQLGRYA